ncbi:hypothetical protein ABW21_db0207134 [Orbilia brochopaga]|nr:hypothetical protein ABW21_db0207134 [Drechslerella brochopaga]
MKLRYSYTAILLWCSTSVLGSPLSDDSDWGKKAVIEKFTFDGDDRYAWDGAIRGRYFDDADRCLFVASGKEDGQVMTKKCPSKRDDLDDAFHCTQVGCTLSLWTFHPNFIITNADGTVAADIIKESVPNPQTAPQYKDPDLVPQSYGKYLPGP